MNMKSETKPLPKFHKDRPRGLNVTIRDASGTSSTECFTVYGGTPQQLRLLVEQAIADAAERHKEPATSAA